MQIGAIWTTREANDAINSRNRRGCHNGDHPTLLSRYGGGVRERTDRVIHGLDDRLSPAFQLGGFSGNPFVIELGAACSQLDDGHGNRSADAKRGEDER